MPCSLKFLTTRLATDLLVIVDFLEFVKPICCIAEVKVRPASVKRCAESSSLPSISCETSSTCTEWATLPFPAAIAFSSGCFVIALEMLVDEWHQVATDLQGRSQFLEQKPLIFMVLGARCPHRAMTVGVGGRP